MPKEHDQNDDRRDELEEEHAHCMSEHKQTYPCICGLPASKGVESPACRELKEYYKEAGVEPPDTAQEVLDELESKRKEKMIEESNLAQAGVDFERPLPATDPFTLNVDDLGEREIHVGMDAPEIDLSHLAEGAKHDDDKLRYDLIPPEALEEIVKVLTFGAKKYGDRNWEQGITYGRVYAALQRHLNEWWKDGQPDEETGLSHLAHAGCCLFFLLTYEERGMKKFDDRPTQEEK